MDPTAPIARRLEGRTVLVTGAASGIGRAACLRVAAEGGNVAAVDVDEQGLESVVGELRAAGASVLGQRVDVSREEDVSAAVSRAAGELGGLHGVVTCAGVFEMGEYVAFADASLELFTRNLSVNLVGTFLAVKHAMPHLVPSKGSVVTIGSIAAVLGNAWAAGYTASKGGVIAMTRLIAAQYGPAGVRANCLCPGGVHTPMTDKQYSDPEVAKKAVQAVPLRRAAQPEEVASTIAFLLSDDSSFMTGSTVVLDGGMTIV